MFPVKIFGVVLKSYCDRNVHAALPSTPILPSPSVSPALRKALVSASVRALAEAEKFFRNSLWRKSTLNLEQILHRNLEISEYCWISDAGYILLALFYQCWGELIILKKKCAYLSSSSSMKPLLSWSMMPKALAMSSLDLPARPTLAKKLLWLKESAAARREAIN